MSVSPTLGFNIKTFVHRGFAVFLFLFYLKIGAYAVLSYTLNICEQL